MAPLLFWRKLSEKEMAGARRGRTIPIKNVFRARKFATLVKSQSLGAYYNERGGGISHYERVTSFSSPDDGALVSSERARFGPEGHLTKRTVKEGGRQKVFTYEKGRLWRKKEVTEEKEKG